MLFNPNNVNFGSLGLKSRVLGLCLGLGALTGCIIVDEERTTVVDTTPPPPPPIIEPMLVTVETGTALDAKPGDGVGVFVEYYAGGTYRIWTTCDTNFSGNACTFDIFTSVDASSTIIGTFQDNLEGFDGVSVAQGLGTADMHFETGSDYDAIEIDVTPGAILRVETLLDNVSDGRFVYWFGDGVLHEGAPTNPLDFFPSKP